MPCNGINDCGDNSDEALCFCPAQEFQCSNGQCIAEYLSAMGAMTAEIDQTKVNVVTQVALGETFLVEEDQEEIPLDQVVTMPATPMNGNVSMANALEASDNVAEKPIVSKAQTRCSAQ